ncbi:MAG: diguanylate cyclase domain-containing protein, partial [Acidobacteriota bacterium]
EVVGEDLVGISIGAVHAPDDGRDAETLLGEADRRMYQTKEERKEAAKVRQLEYLGRKDLGMVSPTEPIFRP